MSEDTSEISLLPEAKKKLETIQSTLEFFRKKFDTGYYTKDHEVFFQDMKEFWEFLSQYDDETYILFQHTDYYLRFKDFFEKIERYYTRTIEAVEAVSVLTKQVEKDTSFFDLFERRLSKDTYITTSRELKLVDLKKCKTLVMIGCGPLPETVLYIHENTPVKKIIGLDKNQEAVYMASRLVGKYHDKISFEYTDGRDYDYSKADIIFVANFITNKKAVFDQIARTGKIGVQVIARESVGFRKMLYEDTVTAIHPRLTLIKKGEFSKSRLLIPLLLKKLDM